MVESSGLLNRRRPLKSTGGSNPPLSARLQVFKIRGSSLRFAEIDGLYQICASASGFSLNWNDHYGAVCAVTATSHFLDTIIGRHVLSQILPAQEMRIDHKGQGLFSLKTNKRRTTQWKMQWLSMLVLANTSRPPCGSGLFWSPSPVIESALCARCQYDYFTPCLRFPGLLNYTDNLPQLGVGPGGAPPSVLAEQFTLTAATDLTVDTTVDYQSQGISCGRPRVSPDQHVDLLRRVHGFIAIRRRASDLRLETPDSRWLLHVWFLCRRNRRTRAAAQIEVFAGGIRLGPGTYTLVENYSDANGSRGDGNTCCDGECHAGKVASRNSPDHEC